MHTPERQREYIRSKMNSGSRFYMLVEDAPAGIVSIRENLIEDLYILPDKQNKGYGTELLQFAVGQCVGIPTLWILENNAKAKKLYRRMGFRETGRINAIADGLDEIELSLSAASDTPAPFAELDYQPAPCAKSDIVRAERL